MRPQRENARVEKWKKVKGIQTMAGAKGNQTLVARLPWALVVRALGDGRVVDARAVHRAASARECALR